MCAGGKSCLNPGDAPAARDTFLFKAQTSPRVLLKPRRHDSYISWQFRDRCARVWSHLGYLISLRPASTSRTVTNLNFLLLQKIPNCLHTCATCSELPSSKSSMSAVFHSSPGKVQEILQNTYARIKIFPVVHQNSFIIYSFKTHLL